MRVETANGAPEFISLRVEENERGCEFEAVHRCEFHAHFLLDIKADDMDAFADADFVIKFLFQLVNDGLNCGAANSIGRLKFKQDRRACADHCLHFFGIVHQRGLARMQDAPRGEQRNDDDAKRQVVVPFWLVCEQDEARHQRKTNSYGDKGILVGY